MAIDPALVNPKTIPSLDNLILATNTYLVGSNLTGTAGKFSVQEFAVFVAQYIAGGGASDYILPIASSTLLGGVKIGSGVNIAGDGTISVPDTWGGLASNYTSGVQLGDIASILGVHTNGFAYAFSLGAMRAFMGMPNGGDTLQSVRDRSLEVSSNSNNLGYAQAAIILREAGRGQTASAAPRIAFHWSGFTATQITILNNGTIAIMDSTGAGYQNLIAANIFAADRMNGLRGEFSTSLTAGRGVFGFDPGVPGSVGASTWFRSTGNTGWFHADFGGGIYMTDLTFVRTYGGKSFYCDNTILGARITALEQLRLPTVTPPALGAGEAAIWIGSLSGITG